MLWPCTYFLCFVLFTPPVQGQRKTSYLHEKGNPAGMADSNPTPGGGLPWVRNCAGHFSCIISFNWGNNRMIWGRTITPRRDEVACSAFHSWEEQEWVGERGSYFISTQPAPRDHSAPHAPPPPRPTYPAPSHIRSPTSCPTLFALHAHLLFHSKCAHAHLSKTVLSNPMKLLCITACLTFFMNVLVFCAVYNF